MADIGSLLHLHFEPQGALLESARECEAVVFQHWFGNTRAQLEQEYAPYTAASSFMALSDADGRVLGSVRFIRPSAAGLKTLEDIERPPWSVDAARTVRAVRIDLSSTWEVATMGVRPGLGGGGVHHALALYHGIIQVARANDASGMVAVMDERVRRLLESVGLVYPAIPGTGTAPYLGSPASVPIYVQFPAVLDVQRRRAPEAHRLIAMGIGLDGVVVPELDAFRHGSRAEREREQRRAG